MDTTASPTPAMIILGVAQDGGVPHIGTASPAWKDSSLRRNAACIGIADPISGQWWMIDATPDIKEQLALFDEVCADSFPSLLPTTGSLAGIALTHAHVGHYLGLAWLGKEMLNLGALPVYAMPRMAEFLSDNLPWSDLVRRRNILLRPIKANLPLQLNKRITLLPISVPHRDEHSETVGFRISGPQRSVLYIPDIDRWEDWDAWGVEIEKQIAEVDLALLDGTFFSDTELPGRDMTLIPHPTVASSMKRFGVLPEEERRKIRFIHLNHSNPLLDPKGKERTLLIEKGFGLAEEGEVVGI